MNPCLLRPSPPWCRPLRVTVQILTTWGRWTSSNSILPRLRTPAATTSTTEKRSSTVGQRSFHQGRVRAGVSGLHQIHQAEDGPRGSTHLGRLLTGPSSRRQLLTPPCYLLGFFCAHNKRTVSTCMFQTSRCFRSLLSFIELIGIRCVGAG